MASHALYTPSFARESTAFASRQRVQQGAVAVMVVGMILVILGVCAMAIDLGLMYNRRVEIQNLASATALAAAGELDGTAAGITRARARASVVATTFRFGYTRPVSWNDSALQFGTESANTGGWLAGDLARASPAGRFFARVDTLALDPEIGTVQAVFSSIFSAERDAVMQGFATAGRTGIKVSPIAVCALSNSPATARVTGAGSELVQFGFRRGITYDLMQLNPNGTTPENFVINPFAPPGTMGTAGPMSPSVVGPYVCSGTMSIPVINGGAITVGRPFPLASLVNHLNSRFDDFSAGACNRFTAPPDANIKAFRYTSIPWMSTVPQGQAAVSSTAGGKLLTIADPDPTPTGNTAAMYGPLWVYAKAVPFSAYVAGSPEPPSGYAPFSSTAWASLYNPGKPVPNNYPSATPYAATVGVNFTAPSAAVYGQPGRRVLNVALLACPVAAGTTVTANVIGVGKFFMTVPATSSTLYAEFAGAISNPLISSSTSIFP